MRLAAIYIWLFGNTPALLLIFLIGNFYDNGKKMNTDLNSNFYFILHDSFCSFFFFFN